MIFIGKYISNLERGCFQAKEKIVSLIAKLKEYRNAIVSAAVTGKIDVRSL